MKDLDSELNRLASIGDLNQVKKLLQDPDIIIDFQDEVFLFLIVNFKF